MSIANPPESKMQPELKVNVLLVDDHPKLEAAIPASVRIW